MKVLRHLPTALLVLLCTTVFGQQLPQLTHHREMLPLYNPAGAGSVKELSATAIHRKQWTGFSGAPVTSGMLVEALVKDHHGLGLAFIKDSYGPFQESNVRLMYGYRLPKMGDGHYLQFGMHANMIQFGLNEDLVNTRDPNDPLLLGGGLYQKWAPDFGAGAMWTYMDYYAGFSVLHLQKSNISAYKQDGLGRIELNRHYHFVGGATFTMDETWFWEPAYMLQVMVNNPNQHSFQFRARYQDMGLAGISFRPGDALSLMLGAGYAGAMIHYSYDLAVSTLRGRHTGTHEIILRYAIPPVGGIANNKRVKARYNIKSNGSRR